MLRREPEKEVESVAILAQVCGRGGCPSGSVARSGASPATGSSAPWMGMAVLVGVFIVIGIAFIIWRKRQLRKSGETVDLPVVGTKTKLLIVVGFLVAAVGSQLRLLEGWMLFLMLLALAGGVVLYAYPLLRKRRKEKESAPLAPAELGAMRKSGVEILKPGEVKTRFSDVAGCDRAVAEIREVVVEFLQHPEKFTRVGAKMPKGILLFGPPGCGKTLLARAAAGESSATFFVYSGTQFVEMYVGVGAARARDLFAEARKKEHQPAIIFIDEIDAIGRKRGSMIGGAAESDSALNQLLVLMDGFSQDPDAVVVVIAATNRPDILDDALTRPGRLDRQIAIERPDLNGRIAILKVHTRGKPLSPNVNLEEIARRTIGMSGADLANVVNEAAIRTARRGGDHIEPEDFDKAIDTIIAGHEREIVLSPEQRRLIAYHEIGHALVGHVLPHADSVQRISITARGRALGYTISSSDEDRYLMAREELMDQMAMAAGGRVAEELFCGQISTGAADDFAKVTQIARKMVTEYVMAEDELGPLVFPDTEAYSGSGQYRYSQELRVKMERAQKELAESAKVRARMVLEPRRALVEHLVETILRKETLEREEFEKIVEEFPGDFPPPPGYDAPARPSFPPSPPPAANIGGAARPVAPTEAATSLPSSGTVESEPHNGGIASFFSGAVREVERFLRRKPANHRKKR